MIEMAAPGRADSIRALISSSDSIIESEHRPAACAPSGHFARYSNTHRSKTPLGAQTESLCSGSSCALDLRRPEHIRIRRRFQIVSAKSRHRKLARLSRIEMGCLVVAGQFLAVDF